MMNRFFPDIPVIPYEGPSSRNPLAFKHYRPDERVGDKTMREHLPFSLAFWHTMRGAGVDMFGSATAARPWDNGQHSPMEMARMRAEAFFEVVEKLGVGYFCFHDRDIAPEADTLQETNNNLDEIAEIVAGLMQKSGVRLLWGTACLFDHPRYMHGAATSCNADVFAYAAAQVKKAMEITARLEGKNYVFWGGREGYDTLLNVDMRLELDNLARFLRMASQYAEDELHFPGQLLIEPKPKEPTTHQYDFDAATVIGFLRQYHLLGHFKLNLEQNHAILAQHSYQHEIQTARINDVLGSLDVNMGDYLLGWDTDQMNTNLYEAIFMMYEVLKNGGIAPGGFNFDAKLRRASFEPDDLFIAHIASMDTCARALKIAYNLLNSGELEDFVADRYESYRSGIGRKIATDEVGFVELERYALEQQTIVNRSGRREWLESIVNRYI